MKRKNWMSLTVLALALSIGLSSCYYGAYGPPRPPRPGYGYHHHHHHGHGGYGGGGYRY